MGKTASSKHKNARNLTTKAYKKEMLRLQVELVKLQEWVRDSGARVAVVFEGRDGAGKGGTISRITQYLNPRVVNVAALPSPSDRERSQWYFQRYIEHLPSAGEIVLFDRSWYNRGGVEYVMGYCTHDEHRLFLRQCPIFEQLLVESGLILIKYWFSVSDQEQERWFVVEADDKQRARLNCFAHLLSKVPYKDVLQIPVTLPPRQPDEGYVRPSRDTYTYVPDHVVALPDP